MSSSDPERDYIGASPTRSNPEVSTATQKDLISLRARIIDIYTALKLSQEYKPRPFEIDGKDFTGWSIPIGEVGFNPNTGAYVARVNEFLTRHINGHEQYVLRDMESWIIPCASFTGHCAVGRVYTVAFPENCAPGQGFVELERGGVFQVDGDVPQDGEPLNEREDEILRLAAHDAILSSNSVSAAEECRTALTELYKVL